MLTIPAMAAVLTMCVWRAVILDEASCVPGRAEFFRANPETAVVREGHIGDRQLLRNASAGFTFR
jgi:hypothetical protein